MHYSSPMAFELEVLGRRVRERRLALVASTVTDVLVDDFQKTAVSTRVDALEQRPREEWEADLGASVQAAIVEVLVAKCRRALNQTGVERLVVSGGVACNRGLRRAVRALGEERGIEVLIPAPVKTTQGRLASSMSLSPAPAASGIRRHLPASSAVTS